MPASRYQPSPRPFPEIVPPVVYGPDEVVRTVTVHGSISWRRRRHFISRGLVGEPVAIRPTLQDAVWDVVYCHRQVATIDLRPPGGGVTYVPAHLSPMSPVCTGTEGSRFVAPAKADNEMLHLAARWRCCEKLSGRQAAGSRVTRWPSFSNCRTKRCSSVSGSVGAGPGPAVSS